MKRLNLKYWILGSLMAVLFTGCELFGLDYQEAYDWDSSAGGNNQLGMSGWEFIQSRTDLFSRFIAAVEYAEIDPELFNQKNITIFALTNQACGNNASTSNSANQFPGGYWYKHPVNGVTPETWSAYSKETVKQFVLQHIMTHAVSYNEFLSHNGGNRIFYPTMATNGYGYVSMHMPSFDENQVTGTGTEAVTLYINDFPSHYMKLNPGANWSKYISPRTANLQTSNGSYVHVMDYFLDFPTDGDLALYPIYGK